MTFNWSPDSQFLAYALGNKVGLHRVYIYSLKDGKSHPVTDGLSDAVEPVFDAAGKYLYFLASTPAARARLTGSHSEIPSGGIVKRNRNLDHFFAPNCNL